MRLILARHGNTFGPGDIPVWVGAAEDLPLTDTGRVQSVQFGLALKEAGIIPARIIAGPLQRTANGAQLAAAECGFDSEIEIDTRLREIDYGSWGGRSDAEIAARWGEKAIDDWRERSIVPAGAGWTPQPADIAANAQAVLQGITGAAKAGDTVLLISSNGILRYFHALLGGDPGRPEASKMRTGHWSVAAYSPAGWALEVWNAPPHPEALGGAG
ncbi:histidine phosphatase family protein [Glycocaulis abyssi]|uniref:Histidine phosphatase family protein n=1 Tax=Glycocaulis abyssi TaxID=1433403 RepID=A0ABV9NBA4_9PROT